MNEGDHGERGKTLPGERTRSPACIITDSAGSADTSLTEAATHEAIEAIETVDRWIERFVIGLGLCPFAAAVRRRGRLHYHAHRSAQLGAVIEAAIACGQSILDANDPDVTAILVLTQGFESFDRYLDLIPRVEDAFADHGFEGWLQVASFHPDYRFGDAPAEDPANYTNRSPWPLLHLLQEDAVARAVEGHPDPESIPLDNVRRLRALGLAGIEPLLGQ